MTDSLGSIAWWGFSPSINLLDYANCKEPGSLNILLIGAADIRHILTTLSRLHRQNVYQKVNFYILESSLELYARHMLFLALVLHHPHKIGLQEKTELFLEIYGNTLIRQQSSDFIGKMAHQFIKMITDFDYLQDKLNILDCSQLKFKERDFLEAIFKFWRNPKADIFNIETCWDIRQRKIMGQRYDCRKNAFDWDYHMKLSERNADVINRDNYRKWRETGIAFEIRDGTYDRPNKTLASGLVLKHDGEKYLRRGYWGDMIVSPYVAMALQSENAKVFEKRNGVYAKTSQEVAEYNITSLIYELINNKEYKRNLSADTEKTCNISVIEEDDEIDCNEDDVKIESDEDNEFIHIPGVKIIFLPMNSLLELSKKKQYQHLFDVVYFSNSMANLFTSEISEMIKEGSNIIFEAAKYILELKKEEVDQFVKRIIEKATDANCEPNGCTDATKDNLIFKFKSLNLET